MASASQAFEGFCRLAGTRKAEFPGTRAVWRDPLEARNWNRRCKTNGGKNANWADGTGPGHLARSRLGGSLLGGVPVLRPICAFCGHLCASALALSCDSVVSPRPGGEFQLKRVPRGMRACCSSSTASPAEVVWAPFSRCMWSRRTAGDVAASPVARITAPFRRAEKCHPLVLGAAGDAGAASWRTRGRCRARCTGAARCVSRTWWSRGGRSGGV